MCVYVCVLVCVSSTHPKHAGAVPDMWSLLEVANDVVFASAPELNKYVEATELLTQCADTTKA